MFFSGLFQRKSDAPVTTPAELADAIGLSYDTYTGKQISSQRAMRLTAVFSCVRVLAESVGMLPCNLYHLNGSLKQRATGERLHKLISTHPNGYMTPQEFWELVVTCLCLRGNFYAYKVKAFGEVAELLPVDPGCVVPARGYTPYPAVDLAQSNNASDATGPNPFMINKATAPKVDGEIKVSFVNSPPGMRVMETRSSGFDVSHDVGYTRFGR